jgi:hypothetical protein
MLNSDILKDTEQYFCDDFDTLKDKLMINFQKNCIITQKDGSIKNAHASLFNKNINKCIEELQ